MEIDKNTGLVLEGGGMRGIFTCGVLDYLIDRHVQFPYTVAVSAGACHGLSYMSHQRGRARFTNIEMMDKYHYIGLKYLFRQRSIINQDLLYRRLPETIYPYDYDTYFNNRATLESVTTNCYTGQPCYLTERKDKDRIVRIARASSSLPYVCPVTYVDHIPMLDGGIVDSIPVMHAREKGFRKNVVVLTRNYGYRKEQKDMRIPNFLYPQFPRLRVALSNRCTAYNEQLALVEQMEKEGEILVIRPQKKMKVDRLEQNTHDLMELYEEGYAEAKRLLDDMEMRELEY
jgi:predicted patatin/cPLA2 family phospholipase